MQTRLNQAMNSLAERAKQRREDLGLTQGQVAKISGLRQPDISKIELGLIKETTKILGLARALQCDPEWLSNEIHSKAPESVVPRAETPGVHYLPDRAVNTLDDRLLSLFSELDTPAKKDLLNYVEGYVAGRRPHTLGTASAVAES